MKRTNNSLLGLLALMSVVGAALPARGGDGVEIDFLGTSNTLVRVKGEGKYLLLPAEDSNEDARVNVLVDGKLDKTIKVKLAKNKVDYVVPFDITPYKGHELALNIITNQGRGSVREAKEDACWSGMTISDTFDTSNREKYRPAYHHTPLWGWMNDPNGMFYKDGVWHLYFQHNPYGSKWENLSWGHSTSKDLIHWEQQAEALEPNGLGMVFSGSCALDTAGSAGFGKEAVVGMYTSADASQVQSLVWSNDNGLTFNFYPGNPVIALESEARDPNMFWDDANKQWILTLAHALDHEMLFFTSPDMKTWTLQSSFGKGIGAQDGVWECPDLFRLPVKGSKKDKWVLLCNINPGGPFGGSATQYFIGDFDGKTFKADTDRNGNIPTKWMDYGKDHYATVSFSDAPSGRRTVMGWMSNWQYAADVPTLQFRSANTLPRDVSLFKAADGQIYLASEPSPELLALRGKLVADVAKTSVSATPSVYNLPAENNGICEILLDVNAAKNNNLVLTLANDKGEKVEMVYDAATHKFSFDRTASGVTSFSRNFPAVTVSPTHETSGKLSLRIFVDRSSIEVFGDNGHFVMTNLVFPTNPYTILCLSSKEGCNISNLKIYSINAD